MTVKNMRPFADMRNLVMVACHAVYTGSDYSKSLDFDSWFLLEYQKVSPAIIAWPHCVWLYLRIRFCNV